MRRHCGTVWRRLGHESGQAIILVAIFMVVLIGFAGLAIDIGDAYFTQRELQKAADAAALSGAQSLPNAAAAAAIAQTYGAASGDKNAAHMVDNATMDVSTRCVPSLGCNASRGITTNVIAVKETAVVPTYFARVLGFGSFTVHATATACSPCSTKPLDVMIVLDRTGSMCQDETGHVDDPQGLNCRDMGYAKQGINVFTSYLDPTIDRVGLTVFPPTPPNPTQAQKCALPTQNPNFYNYDNQNAAYVMVPLSSSFGSGSTFATTLACIRSAGNTSYADALEQTQAVLHNTSRPDAVKVIVFLSDGAANYGGTWHGNASNPYRATPCHQGVTSAGYAKADPVTHTLIYTLGYDLNLNNPGANYEKCKNSNGQLEAGGITSFDAIKAIASGPTNFYYQPEPGPLNQIFTQMATDISSLFARLVADDVN